MPAHAALCGGLADHQVAHAHRAAHLTLDLRRGWTECIRSTPVPRGRAQKINKPILSANTTPSHLDLTTKHTKHSPPVAAPAPTTLRPLPTLAWAALGVTTVGLAYPSPSAAAAAAGAAVAPSSAGAGAVPSPSSSAAAADDVYAPPVLPPAGLPAHVTLYQYEVCPFCCKVKAALDFYGVPYSVVEVSPLTKRQLKGLGGGQFKKVPVAILDAGSVVADSSAIISRLAAGAQAAGKGGKGGKGGWPLFGGRSTATTTTPGDASASAAAVSPAAAELAWRRWVDGRLVRVLTLNIYRSPGEAWQAFDYITQAGNFGGAAETAAARVLGAGMMWAIAGRLAAKYGILQAPRDALASVGGEWVDGALGGGARPFAGGQGGPDLADLSAFGVWRAVKGTDTFEAAMEGNAALAAWYGRMEGVVGPSARVEVK